MNIIFCPLQHKHNYAGVVCPICHSRQCRKHGSYYRKGFHQKNTAISVPVSVPIARFRCTNPQCKRRTFSLLPPMAVRYCRFFWPDLQIIWRAITKGRTPYQIAKDWGVDRAVIVRVAALQCTLQSWIEKQYQELRNGTTLKPRNLARIVKIIAGIIGLVDLMNRWYCHHYPRRYLVM